MYLYEKKKRIHWFLKLCSNDITSVGSQIGHSWHTETEIGCENGERIISAKEPCTYMHKFKSKDISFNKFPKYKQTGHYKFIVQATKRHPSDANLILDWRTLWLDSLAETAVFGELGMKMCSLFKISRHLANGHLVNYVGFYFSNVPCVGIVHLYWNINVPLFLKA